MQTKEINSVSNNLSGNFQSFSEIRKKDELCGLFNQATFLRSKEIDFINSLKLNVLSRSLEVGCGHGFITGILADIFPDGMTHGIDNSAELIAIANQVVKKKHRNIDFFLGNACSLPFEENTYDFVYGRMLYQHLDDPLMAMKEARRVLRSRGKVCIVDIDAGLQLMEPNCPAFDKLNDLAVEAQKKSGGDRFIGRKIPGIMKQAGFSKVEFKELTISSLDMRMEDYLNVTTRFKEMLIGTSEASELSNEIEIFCKKNEPFVLAGVIAVIGFV